MDYKEEAEQFLDLNAKLKDNLSNKRLNRHNVGEMAFLTLLFEFEDGLSSTELADKLNVVPSRITALIASLVKKEFVKKNSDPNDRRKYKVVLTSKGKDYFIEEKNIVIDILSDDFRELGEKDTKEFIRLYSKLIDIKLKRNSID